MYYKVFSIYICIVQTFYIQKRWQMLLFQFEHIEFQSELMLLKHKILVFCLKVRQLLIQIQMHHIAMLLASNCQSNLRLVHLSSVSLFFQILVHVNGSNSKSYLLLPTFLEDQLQFPNLVRILSYNLSYLSHSRGIHYSHDVPRAWGVS